ncbi:MAG: arginine repressor [Lachnospiraceae bacterium]|nr:arginine repressor [Lachnospiraceae bacterium]
MRHDRQDRILKLISEKPIGTQEELSDLLTKEGFNATQATISRDIRQLGLTKVPCETGGFKYAALGKGSAEDMSEKFIRVLHDGFVSMDMAQNILVIKTVSGMAMAVAAAIDSMKFEEVVGCIAGDDTIMVAVRTAPDTRRLMERIRIMLQDR